MFRLGGHQLIDLNPLERMRQNATEMLTELSECDLPDVILRDLLAKIEELRATLDAVYVRGVDAVVVASDAAHAAAERTATQWPRVRIAAEVARNIGTFITWLTVTIVAADKALQVLLPPGEPAIEIEAPKSLPQLPAGPSAGESEPNQ